MVMEIMVLFLHLLWIQEVIFRTKCHGEEIALWIHYLQQKQEGTQK